MEVESLAIYVILALIAISLFVIVFKDLNKFFSVTRFFRRKSDPFEMRNNGDSYVNVFELFSPNSKKLAEEKQKNMEMKKESDSKKESVIKNFKAKSAKWVLNRNNQYPPK